MKVQNDFYLTEFVSPSVYNVLKEQSYYLLDPNIYNIAQFYRDWLGISLMVNNWFDGGNLEERGHRPYNTSTGAMKSFHKLGMAFDCSWDFNATPINDLVGYVESRKIFLKKQYGIGRIIIYPWGLHTDLKPTEDLQILSSV